MLEECHIISIRHNLKLTLFKIITRWIEIRVEKKKSEFSCIHVKIIIK